jgi:hypothetical protein
MFILKSSELNCSDINQRLQFSYLRKNFVRGALFSADAREVAEKVCRDYLSNGTISLMIDGDDQVSVWFENQLPLDLSKVIAMITSSFKGQVATSTMSAAANPVDTSDQSEQALSTFNRVFSKDGMAVKLLTTPISAKGILKALRSETDTSS